MMDILPVIFFLTVLVFLMAGFPVAFTLGGVSFLFGIFLFGPEFFNLLPLRIWGIMGNYILLAVPLFIFMGVMFEKSGLAEELLETMALLFGKLRGGMAVSVLFVGAMLAAATGIVGATVVTMGVLSLPVMLKRGYNSKVACGIITSSGTLGQIIPPSIVLVLLGSVMNVSVGDLFMAAFVPGILLVTFYLFWIIFQVIKKPENMPAMPAEEIKNFRGDGMVKKVLLAFAAPFLLITTVLGSIFAGVASPTEAAAIGALGAVLLTLLRGKFSSRQLKEVMKKTTSLTSMAFMILTGASAFSLVFRGMGGDHYLSDLISSYGLGPYQFLAIIMFVIFIAGFFIDFIEIIFIIIPVALPLLLQLEINLLWAAILIAVNLQASFLTPPFGFSLFFLKGVAPPEVKTTDIYRGAIPYVAIQLFTILLLFIFPEVVLWFPSVFD